MPCKPPETTLNYEKKEGGFMVFEGFMTVILAMLAGILTLSLFMMVLIVCMIALSVLAVLLKRVNISGAVNSMVREDEAQGE